MKQRELGSYTNIGKHIAGLGSNAEIAQALSVSRQAVSQKLRGKTAIFLEDIERLALAFNKKVTWFFQDCQWLAEQQAGRQTEKKDAEERLVGPGPGNLDRGSKMAEQKRKSKLPVRSVEVIYESSMNVKRFDNITSYYWKGRELCLETDELNEKGEALVIGIPEGRIFNTHRWHIQHEGARKR